jgi:predicted GIY-YIG superfamily endonuclease
MYYVYLIESLSAARDRYVGITSNLEQRLREHNAGKSSHTSKFKPWKLTTTSHLLTEPREKLSSAISNLAQGMLSLVSDYGNEVPENFAHVICQPETVLQKCCQKVFSGH